MGLAGWLLIAVISIILSIIVFVTVTEMQRSIRREEKVMRWILLVILASGFLFGCAANSDWMKHDTLFASGAHMSYSLWGYKHPSAKWQKLSDEQGWWGTPIRYRSED